MQVHRLCLGRAMAMMCQPHGVVSGTANIRVRNVANGPYFLGFARVHVCRCIIARLSLVNARLSLVNARSSLVKCSFIARKMLVHRSYQCSFTARPNARSPLVKCSYIARSPLVQCSYIARCLLIAHLFLVKCSSNNRLWSGRELH